jgi:ABC-type taurine transport system ATPase subunit
MAEVATPTEHTSPDVAASRLLRSFRRISWQRIEIADDGECRAVVFGVRHRLPTRVQVPVDVALALRARGIRTIVRQGAVA